MNGRQLWNSHQRHKFWRAKASRDDLKIIVSVMAFPRVFKRCFQPLMPCCFIRIHASLGTMPSQVPGVPRHRTVQTFHRSKPVRMCIQCHSKLGNRCFTVLFDDA